METLLTHPAVQGGIAPLVVGLVIAALLGRVRLGGLAVAAGFCVAVALISGLTFTPLSATRKIVLLALIAPLVGMLIDFASKSGRSVAIAIAAACGALSVWVFWSMLQQKSVATAFALGGGTAVFIAWLVAATMDLSDQSVRAGATALALGLGVGITAILGASALLGLYGIAIGAGAGAFLLRQMATGRTIVAGATLTLAASVTAGLLAVGAYILAEVPWYALIALALIPLAVRLPVSDKLPLWAQAFIAGIYGIAPAFVAFVLTWRAAPTPA
jgi:hypothetical protein